MLKGAIFDFDGTIADSEVCSYFYIKSLLQEKGRDLTKEEYGKEFSGVSTTGNMNNLNENYGFDFTKETFLSSFKEFMKDYYKENKLEIKPGVVEIVKYLNDQGIKLAIGTSSTLPRVLNFLEENNIREYFSEFVSTEDTKVGKPNPEVFLLALKKLGVEKDECIIFEDAELGIEAANNAGIDVICIPDIKYPDEEHTNMCYKVVSRIDESIDFLER